MAPAMVVRIAGNIDELKRNLREGRDEIQVTTAGMQKLANSFSGEKLVQQAHNVVAAVQQVGGASKLTEAEQARVNATLERAIEKFQVMGQVAPKAMLTLAAETQNTEERLRSLDKYGVQAIDRLGNASTGATPMVGGLRSEFQRFDGVLAAAGIHIGPQIKGIEDIANAAGKTASQVGALGTAGLALGAGFAGWGLGRMAADFLGLDKSVESAWRQLLHYGDVVEATAGSRQDVINRAIANGAKETISYSEAIRFNIEVVQRSADANINWSTRLAAAQREVRGLSEATMRGIELAQQSGATTEQITNKYGVSALALQVLAERHKLAASATAEHRAQTDALAEAKKRETAELERSYAALMSEVKNRTQLAIMDADAKAMTDAKTRAAEGWIGAQVKATAASREAAAAESARVAQNQAEIDQVVNSVQKLTTSHKEAGAAAAAGTDQAAFGWAGVVQQVTITGEAVKEYLSLMRYAASVNAINSENSLFATQSQRERIAQVGVPSFASGVTNFAGGVAKVHRDELLVNLPAGTNVIPRGGGGGGGGVTIVNHVAVNGSVLSSKHELADAVGEAFMTLMRSGALALPDGA